MTRRTDACQLVWHDGGVEMMRGCERVSGIGPYRDFGFNGFNGKERMVDGENKREREREQATAGGPCHAMSRQDQPMRVGRADYLIFYLPAGPSTHSAIRFGYGPCSSIQP